LEKYDSRVKRIFNKIALSSDAFLITNLKNINYLTGFTGSFAVALLTENGCYLLVDFRYFEQAKKEAHAEIVLFKETWLDTLMKLINEKKIKKLCFEVSCSYETFLKLSGNKEIQLIPQSHIVEHFRAIKEEEEIENIKEAIKRAEKAFLKIKPLIKEGITERAIAIALEYEIKQQGSDILPFPVIVASGSNSSMPHWKNSDRTLKKGDFVIIDWGAEYKGYFSDMTRTFIIGEVSERQKEIYNIVNKARNEAIISCRPGIQAKQIDTVARNFIKLSGYGENFGHATGHGVGLDIHEFPKINRDSNEEIQQGMVFTVEPGIYIEEFGGVRIEDMVVVREKTAEILTNLPRDLEIL